MRWRDFGICLFMKVSNLQRHTSVKKCERARVCVWFRRKYKQSFAHRENEYQNQKKTRRKHFCSQYFELVHNFRCGCCCKSLNEHKSMMECDEFNQTLVDKQKIWQRFLLILMAISQAIQICMEIKKKRTEEERKKKNKHKYMVKLC